MWGSGDTESREYNLRGFTAVKAGGSFRIEIIQSDTFGVTVCADRDTFSKIVVRASGGELRLDRKPLFWNFLHTEPEATIRMPELDSVELHGATSGRIRDFRGIDRLHLDLTGASDLRAGIEAASIDILAAGASRLSLAGWAALVTLNASGASRLDLAGLRAAVGTVELSGASRARVHFTDAIDLIDVSGASRLRYLGDPRIKCIDSSGSSHVSRVA